jgi:hypothetical protein
LDAITSTEKENLQKKRKQMQRMTKTIRQTEEPDNKPTRPRQDPESPLRR